MGKTLINIRVEDELKKSTEEIFHELGMDMTTAITIFLKKVTREKRIPFEVAIDPFYSESNMQALKESAEQLKSGKTVVKTMEELEKMEE